jgi:serine-type D-Ala-D-Ala carboxypeptidase
VTGLADFDRHMREVVASSVIAPGAVVLGARGGKALFHRAYGFAQTHDEDGPLPSPRPMRPETIFDVASLTKLFTTAAVMRLEAAGRLALDTPVRQLLPFLSGEPTVTVDHLLTHRGGLAAWQPLYLYADTPADAIRWIATHGRCSPPDRERRYSDLGFVLLGAIVEQVAGRTLDSVIADEVLAPLGMSHTAFTPPPGWRTNVAATSTGNETERRMIAAGDPEPVEGSADDFAGWRTHTLVGEVNDGNAWYGWQGVAGHAGLFSTAQDLAVFAQTILNQGAYGHRRLFAPATVAAFGTRQRASAERALGWDTPAPESSAGSYFSAASIGHTGFTGTSIWIDPERGLFVILLTNRVNPTAENTLHIPLRRAVADAVQAAVLDAPLVDWETRH